MHWSPIVQKSCMTKHIELRQKNLKTWRRENLGELINTLGKRLKYVKLKLFVENFLMNIKETQLHLCSVCTLYRIVDDGTMLMLLHNTRGTMFWTSSSGGRFAPREVLPWHEQIRQAGGWEWYLRWLSNSDVNFEKSF